MKVLLFGKDLHNANIGKIHLLINAFNIQFNLCNVFVAIIAL